MKRLVVRLVILAVLSVSTVALNAVCRYRGPQLPDGYITCKAVCTYPATCEVKTDRTCQQYCYYDFIAGVCFDGDYEEGCSTGPLGF